ncbi:hypothetical protein D3C87_1742340 [compost metagenome]
MRHVVVYNGDRPPIGYQVIIGRSTHKTAFAQSLRLYGCRSSAALGLFDRLVGIVALRDDLVKRLITRQ